MAHRHPSNTIASWRRRTSTSVFVDTSALYALLDRRDPSHRAAAAAFARLPTAGRPLSHNYVVVESVALVHRRFGPAATRALLDELLGPVKILWVDEDVHRAAAAAFLAAPRRRGVSLVDRVSFEIMRRNGISTAFAFDRDFETEGFDLLG